VYGPARRLRLPLLLLALLVASCAPGRTPSPAIAPIPLPAVSAPIISGADQLVPLPDGPSAFAAIVDVLRAARRSIELELYEFQRLDLVAMLLDAHDRGLTVTAIKDPSERSSETSWAVLEQGGVRVVAFPLERLTIDHVKLLIVDGVRAIVGGINWGSHSALNHDVDVLAAGPVVDNLERVFRQDLALAGEPTPIPPPAPDRHVEVLVTHPGDGIRAAALAAVARGVSLRALLDPTQPQNATTMALLQAAGAAVRFYVQAGDELLHAKLGIFDRATVLFGSCNWSYSGFARNHELDLLVHDARLARIFLSRLEQDWVASTP